MPADIPKSVSTLASWIFGLIFVIFLFTFTLLVPHPTPSQMAVVQLVMALTAAFLSVFLLGGIILHGTLAGWRISATSGIALFVLIEVFPNPLLKPSPEVAKEPKPAAVSGSHTDEIACHDEGQLRSSFGLGSKQVSLRFENKLDRNFQIFWLDYDGKRQPFGMLPARGTIDMDTFTSHPWLVADEQGRCTGIYVPQTRDEIVVVGESN
ncbi:MAG: hypothetical protein DME34_05075 [Verrucomicrobia bacterium]|nr:MAG: hypothetical protein DME34_05075 [Verrucomicrobiota bacterium]